MKILHHIITGKPYLKLLSIKIKFKGTWYEGVLYMCLYRNKDGMFYARTKEDFEENFKSNDDSNNMGEGGWYGAEYFVPKKFIHPIVYWDKEEFTKLVEVMPEILKHPAVNYYFITQN